MRSGWIKEATGQFPDMKGRSLKKNGSKDRRTQDVKRRRTCHKLRISIERDGNTHRHITGGTGEGTDYRSDQLSSHPEIAKLDNPFTGQEKVRRLYIPVDNLFSVQVCQSL